MKKVISIYLDSETLEKFVADTDPQQSDGKRVASAIRRIVSGQGNTSPATQPERIFSESTIARLERLFAFRKAKGKHPECEDLECFLNSLLDTLRDDILFITPNDL